MRFGSVCSGIEAASVAWHGLGWEPAWLSEVDVAAERPGRAVGVTSAIAIQERAVADTNAGPGGKGWRDDDCAYTMEARHRPQYVCYEVAPQWWDGSPVSQTLDAVLHKGQTMPEKNRFPAVLQPIPFVTTQITSPQNGCNPKPGAPCHPLAAGAHPPVIAFHPTQDPISSEDLTHALSCGSSSGQASIAIAFSSKDYGADATEELAPTMRAMGHKDSHPNAGGQIAVCVTGDRTHALNTANNGKGCSEDGTGRGVPTVAFMTRGSNVDVGEISGTIGSNCDRASGSAPMVQQEMVVRRLMPVECERLQGFFDWWTAVPTTPVSTANQAKAREAMEAGDPSFCEIDGAIFNVAADGPRYKQLGNSWAVPVVAWIGARIDRHVRALDSRTVSVTLDPAAIAWIIAA